MMQKKMIQMVNMVYSLYLSHTLSYCYKFWFLTSNFITGTNTDKCKSSSVVSGSKSMANIGSKKRRNIASASTTLLFGTILGLLQAVTLVCAAKPLLGVMGLKYVSYSDVSNLYWNMKVTGKVLMHMLFIMSKAYF